MNYIHSKRIVDKNKTAKRDEELERDKYVLDLVSRHTERYYNHHYKALHESLISQFWLIFSKKLRS